MRFFNRIGNNNPDYATNKYLKECMNISQNSAQSYQNRCHKKNFTQFFIVKPDTYCQAEGNRSVLRRKSRISGYCKRKRRTAVELKRPCNRKDNFYDLAN